MSFLRLITERLEIRNLHATDAADFHEYRSNPEVTEFQGFDVMDLPQCSAFIDSQKDLEFGIPGQWVQYGIILKDSSTVEQAMQKGKLIGDCAVKLDGTDPRLAEIGITISHLHQRKGYAKEAFAALLDFLFAECQVHRITETVDAANVASIALLESLGFRKEGHFIENIFFKGKWGSECQYALLRREWKAGH